MTDAILDDIAMESFGNSGKKLNLMYGKSDATLKAIYNGSRLKISQEDAALMSGHTDGQHFADFVNTFSVDALSELSSDMQLFGLVHIRTMSAVSAATLWSRLFSDELKENSMISQR